MAARKYTRSSSISDGITRVTAMQRRALGLARALRADALTAADRETLAEWMDAIAGEQKEFADAVRTARRATRPGHAALVATTAPNPRAVELVNALFKALGGKAEATRPRKNATRYPAIAYHWAVCKELKLSRTYVAKTWGLPDEKTVTDALRDHRLGVTAELEHWIGDGERRGFTRHEVLESEELRARPRRASRKIPA